LCYQQGRRPLLLLLLLLLVLLVLVLVLVLLPARQCGCCRPLPHSRQGAILKLALLHHQQAHLLWLLVLLWTARASWAGCCRTLHLS
jgi:hypothetical protein